jgi:hypothetical protein
LTVFFVIIIIKQINTFFVAYKVYMSVRSRIRCYQEHAYIHTYEQLILNSYRAIFIRYVAYISVRCDVDVVEKKVTMPLTARLYE